MLTLICLPFLARVHVAYPSLHGFTTFPCQCHLCFQSPIACCFISLPSHVMRSTPSFVVLPATFKFVSLLSAEEIYPPRLKAYHLKECNHLSTLGNAYKISLRLFHPIVEVLVMVRRQTSHLSVAEVHLWINIAWGTPWVWCDHATWVDASLSFCLQQRD